MDTDIAQLVSEQPETPESFEATDKQDGISEREDEDELPAEPEVLPEKIDPKTWRKLPDLLGLLGIPGPKEYQEWLDSEFFKPMWDQLWTEHIKRQQDLAKLKGFRRPRGPSLRETQKAIIDGERLGMKRYTRKVGKDKWTKLDHYACFLLHVRTENTELADGLFFDKNLPLDTVDILIWQVLQRVSNETRPSTLKKRQVQSRANYRAYNVHKRKATRGIHSLRGKFAKIIPRDPSDAQMQNTVIVKEEDTTDTIIESIESDEHVEDEPAPDWDCEPLQPKERLKLTAKSETMDMSDPFWKVNFVEAALRKAVEQPPNIDNIENAEGADYAAGQDETMEAFMWNAELTASQFEDDSRAAEGYIIEPSQKEIERFAEQQTWLDNEALQRENHAEACMKLGIANHRMPRLRTMRKSVVFKYWQPTAIHALLEFESSPHLRGAFLADGVGLGKTWVLIGFLLTKLQRFEEQEGSGSAKPALIVVPPGLISQWADEIHKVTNVFKVYSYYGERRKSPAGIYENLNGRMSKDHFLFDNEMARRYTVILTTYQTFASRHGPKAQDEWRKKTKKMPQDMRKRLLDTLDTDWPMCMGGRFETVILDEAQFIRNLDTSSSKAIGWLAPTFSVCVSATPIWNSIDDFRGFVPLLFKNHRSAINAPQDFGLSSDENPFNLPEDHPGVISRLTKWAVEKYIFDDRIDPALAGYRMGKIWEACLIRRTYSSQIPFNNGRCIGKSIPPTQNRILQVSFTEQEQEKYDDILPVLRQKLFRRGKDRNGRNRKVLLNMSVFRQIVLLTTWLPFQHIHKAVKALNMKNAVAQAYKKTLAHRWLKILASNDPDFAVPEKDDYFNQLVLLLQGSPRLRAELPLICEEVLVRNEKSIVWCSFPAQQVLLAAAFHLVGIDAVVYSASLNQKERTELVRSFTQDTNKTMVLICSYFVNSSGLSFQNLCRNVHLFDTAMSDAYITQAIGRIRRLGQRQVVRVYEIQVKNSYNTQQVMKNMQKSVPGMIALLNKAIFDVNVGGSGGKIDIGTWAINPDGNLVNMEDVRADERSKTQWLTGEAVIMAMLEIMKGEVVEIDR